ncbi:hypothetical protein [Thiorhodococcus fuscus]|uniref:AprA-like MT2-like domain-containing protein n=1 Tax=Thiorhodococcus fuscus TaxID=527200 RepID=A0ABW4YBC1_9GAMM
MWASLCPLLDGLALGCMIEALEAAGALAELRGLPAPEQIDRLARRWGARPGYLHLVLRALAQLGLMALDTDADGRRRVSPTTAGRDWLVLTSAYRGFAQRLSEAAAMPDWAEGRIPPPEAPPPLPPQAQGGSRASRLVASHLWGPLITAFLTLCHRRANRADPAIQASAFAMLEAAGTVRQYGESLLVAQGWGGRCGEDFVLDAVGELALLAAPQCFHTLSYLPTLIRSDRLLFGEDARPPQPTADGRETHLDRALDIAFSGLVFRRGCGAPFLRMLLPLFSETSPPTCVVDVGCGDGTLLLELGRGLRQAGFDTDAVTLVGVDPAPEARAETGDRLAREGLRHLILDGDIAAPEAIAAQLAEKGLALHEGLFVSKSVFHDRRFEPPAANTPEPTGEASRCVFIDEDGGPLAARAVERHLIELLLRWRPWIGRHGMIVIEAHTADPSHGAAHAGRHVLVPLEVTHGLSHQYLLEAERFRALVAQAGYRSVASTDLNTWLVGRPLMTIDRYVVDVSRNDRISAPTPSLS